MILKCCMHIARLGSDLFAGGFFVLFLFFFLFVLFCFAFCFVACFLFSD